MVDIKKDYDFEWRIDANGDIIDEEGVRICFFAERSVHASIIQYAPAMFNAIKEVIENYNTTKAIQRPVYEKLCMLIEKINDG